MRSKLAIPPDSRRRGGARPGARPAAPPLPTFSERVEVRVLDLDVDVTDSKGNPVTDLKREDFTVRIGKKAVPIDYFARVDQGAIHAPDLASASPDQVLAHLPEGRGSLRAAQLPDLRRPRVPLPGRPQPQPRGAPGLRHPPRPRRRGARRRLRPLSEGPRGLDDQQGSRDVRPLLDRVEGRRHVAAPGRAPDAVADRLDAPRPPGRHAHAARAPVRRRGGPGDPADAREHEGRARHAHAAQREEVVPVPVGRLRVPAGLRHVPVRRAAARPR